MTSRYIHGHHESVLRSHALRTAENSAGYLLPYLRPEHTLLDIGAGPGTITAGLADRVARVVATEVDEGTLNKTRACGHDRVEYVVADAHALDFADDSFDVVHAHQVLQHLVDPVRAMREMRRVCHPGGIIAVRDVDYSAISIYPNPPELAQWLETYQLVARAQGGEPDAGPRLMAWARAAGCSRITPSASVWLYATPETRAKWGGDWADRALYSTFAEMALLQGVERATLQAISDAWRRWAAEPDGWITLTHGEIIARP